MDWASIIVTAIVAAVPTLFILVVIWLMKSNHSQFEKVFAEKFSSLEKVFAEKFNSLEEGMKALTDRVSRIEDVIMNSTKRGTASVSVSTENLQMLVPPTTTSRATSPTTLSQIGRNLSERMKAEVIVKAHLDRVRFRIPEDAHKLQIQDICFNYALNGEFLSNVSHAERKLIWDFIYETGGNGADILIIYGILFRDAIFEERGIIAPAVSKNSNKKSTIG